MTTNGPYANGDYYHPDKGDVCYVLWRKEFWPALVKNTYPKKITYAFFPLPTDGKATIFTLMQPLKKARKLTTEDDAPTESTNDYRDALQAAKEYMALHGETEGWKCNVYDPIPHLTRGMLRANAPYIKTEDSDEDEEAAEEEESFSDADLESDQAQSAEGSVKDENDKPEEISEPKIKKKRVGGRPAASRIDDPDRPYQNYGFAPCQLLKYTKDVPFSCIIFENLDKFMKEIWESPAVRHYRVPARYEVSMTLPFAKILNDNDTDLLFEHCLNFVRAHEPECRTLPALDLVTSVIFPEVILKSLMMEKKFTHQEALDYMISYTGKFGNNDNPEAKGPLQFLAEVATDESRPKNERPT